MVEVGGETVTLATAASTTVTCAVPDWPSMVAVTVTGPPATTPVMPPTCDTVTSASLLLLHSAGRLGNSLPWASNAFANYGRPWMQQI